MSLRSFTFGNSEMVFLGKPLAQGIARGIAYLLKRVDIQSFRNDKRTVDLVSSELARFDFAIIKSKEQISRFISNNHNEATEQSYPIFEAEVGLLNDPVLVIAILQYFHITIFVPIK